MSTPDDAQARIYQHHAAEYDALVSAEDVDQNLLPAIARAVPGGDLRGLAVLEIGVGTGRVTRLLIEAGVARLVGVEPAAPMLAIARHRLLGRPTTRALAGSTLAPTADVALIEADARALPTELTDHPWADLALAGWVFGHFRTWMPEGWKSAIGEALGAMRRALKPGGTLVLIETLGTGREVPAPPSDALGEYYHWLETEHGLRRTAIRTDYQFPDVANAERITGFFFGAAFGARVRAQGWMRIPECTGIWAGQTPPSESLR
jgi:SAM-dependent methyltransferase